MVPNRWQRSELLLRGEVDFWRRQPKSCKELCMARKPHESDILLSRLTSIYTLTEREQDTIRSLPIHVVSLDHDQDIVREGDRPTRSCLVVKGMTCWYRVAESGKRQIANFHIPGDIPDLQSLHLPVMDSSLATLTPCTVAFIDHEAILRLCAAEPNVANAMWKMTLIEAGIFRAWITNIGGNSAYSRIAHLLCEMVTRLRAVGLTDGGSGELPITQLEIADATGLSLVHVNRNIQKLRTAGLIEWNSTTLTILRPDALAEAGDFDPTYLHLLERT